MEPGSFRFEGFSLDARDRRLRRGDVPVELNARYLDALTLLVREQGRLVSKDRFLEEVWRGVPVTDEALTQCIRTLRRQLGDDAARPRFIETVPKHGYRFIAPIEWIGDGTRATAESAPSAAKTTPPYGWRQFLLLGGAGRSGQASPASSAACSTASPGPRSRSGPERARPRCCSSSSGSPWRRH
jgi:DNA-binding winged helix-turn-helix (wHTH) protein